MQKLVAQILSKVAVIFWLVCVSYLSSVVSPRADGCPFFKSVVWSVGWLFSYDALSSSVLVPGLSRGIPQ